VALISEIFKFKFNFWLVTRIVIEYRLKWKFWIDVQVEDLETSFEDYCKLYSIIKEVVGYAISEYTRQP
jgi:hypothetical protein